METLFVPPFKAPARGLVTVPGSKSINNRALLLAALSNGPGILNGALDSDDTRIFATCLNALGFNVAHDPAAARFTVEGCGGNLPSPNGGHADLFVGNAGTAARFLLALSALGSKPIGFDGVAAMRKRPMGDLLEALRAQGAIIVCEEAEGHFPLTINGAGLRGGKLELDPQRSSQQVSAILMVAPFAKANTELVLTGPIVSEPYIVMTIDMMAQWGVQVERPEPNRLVVAAGQAYQAKASYAVEPDASSASYFFAAAAVTGGKVTVAGLSRKALQGDVLFVDALVAMGATVEEDDRGLTVIGPAQLGGLEIDMNAISDTAPTLAAIAANATTPVLIKGVEHMRWKETDRIHAMATQLRAMGADLDENRDGLLIRPSRLVRTQVATFDDHRMAMSLAITGLANQGVTIIDPACTSKTFPNFFEVLAQLRHQSGA
ncbi:3-phosphoshikimate 1-carboxyvinyltransferase [Candidatus Phycosocius spiralis]|uniref:3-phosphoshikimate 1-carboxyvinyltransferase n=1 Tax=Candidatus Phycosocius spiralis TaxID=2815099 RepID=A0ABQ4PUD6_9PROT|nr:3-phosphoshikimate 1-carboxyvinyltransferase [Candidatus Phycosocius spiralis]GIU66626.1 3-phosphoshikimate 1-carboxyvinyltransferase [Candidatus Phycosocius spiralis]